MCSCKRSRVSRLAEGVLKGWNLEDGDLDRIPGGLSSGQGIDGLDPYELALGAAVEREHTDDPRIAVEISSDHLRENPRYYSILLKIGL